MLWLFLALQDVVPTKLPEPPAAAQKEIEKAVRDVYKAEYSNKEALAEKMIQKAGDAKLDAAMRYVLLREARDLAAQAGNVALAFRAVDEMGAAFTIDPIAFKAAALGRVKGAGVDAWLELATQAVAADAFEQAVSLLTKAGSDPRAKAAAAEVSALQKEFSKIKGLKDDPENPASQLTLGRYLCFVKGDWDKGLPKLARGSDAALKSLAEKDTAKGDPVELGDAWWDMAEKEKTFKTRIRTRARFWYEQALPNAAGLDAMKIQKRIGESQPPPVAPGGKVELLKLIDPKSDSLKGTWTGAGGSIMSPTDEVAQISIPYSPPAEYDLTLVVERKQGSRPFCIGLSGGGAQFAVGLDAMGGTVSGLAQLDGQWFEGNETSVKMSVFAAGKPLTIVCSVRAASVGVSVDGKKIISWKADFKRISLPPEFAGAPPLFLASRASVYEITRLTLAPVSGQGKPLR